MTDQKMTHEKTYATDIVIIGGGIAGITLALELLEQGEKRQITLLDTQGEKDFGGLARKAFGGMMFVDSPIQRKSGIKDSRKLALKDWYNFAEFGEEDYWPKKWAKYYVTQATKTVYHWITAMGLKFLPAVQWVERGLYVPGNSVPRYHILSGTAEHLTKTLIARLNKAAVSGHLIRLFNHKVTRLLAKKGAVTGVMGRDISSGQAFTIKAGLTVIATGGIGGNIDKVKDNWPTGRGKPPDVILNGCHPSADGALHDQVESLNGEVTHLDKMWNYAAGVRHPKSEFDDHGLSLIPTRSSLWLDHSGRRIGPMPLITGFDTHYLCEQVSIQEKPWTWHVMNWKIIRRELAISGAEHNPDLRDRKIFKMLLKMLFANGGLARQMLSESNDFIMADSLPELTHKMNALTGKKHICPDVLTDQISTYDQQLDRGGKFHNDDQIRRLHHLRQWMGDRIRTCKNQKILDPKAGPLIAIRTHLISRKTLGGIQTNLDCQVMSNDGTPITNLFAVGEAAGFGGGGASGKRSLEGTFLSGCILTARRAAQVIYDRNQC